MFCKSLLTVSVTLKYCEVSGRKLEVVSMGTGTAGSGLTGCGHGEWRPSAKIREHERRCCFPTPFLTELH